jgi:hypothetical protein
MSSGRALGRIAIACSPSMTPALQEQRSHLWTPIVLSRGLLLVSSGHGAERRRVADHVDARGLLLDVYTGHGGVVAALRQMG